MHWVNKTDVRGQILLEMSLCQDAAVNLIWCYAVICWLNATLQFRSTWSLDFIFMQRIQSFEGKTTECILLYEKSAIVLHKKEIHMGLKWHQVSISKQNLSKLWKNANKTFYCVENQPWRNSIWRRHQWNIFSVFAAYYCGTFCSWFKMQYEKRWMILYLDHV